MSNGTKDPVEGMQERLATLVDEYRGLLRADERRLHEAMLEYERCCCDPAARQAA